MNDWSTFLGTVAHDVYAGLARQPWIVAAVALAVLVTVVRIVRTIMHDGPRDAQRRFSPADRRTIFERAGGRCEAHRPLVGRCRAQATQADHIHPWSRGGATTPANGAALCTRHNSSKGARIPWDVQLRAMERRRRGYVEPGLDVGIVRKLPPPAARRVAAHPGRNAAAHPGRHAAAPAPAPDDRAFEQPGS